MGKQSGDGRRSIAAGLVAVFLDKSRAAVRGASGQFTDLWRRRPSRLSRPSSWPKRIHSIPRSWLFYNQQKFVEALPLALEALEIRKKVLGERTSRLRDKPSQRGVSVLGHGGVRGKPKRTTAKLWTFAKQVLGRAAPALCFKPE